MCIFSLFRIRAHPIVAVLTGAASRLLLLYLHLLDRRRLGVQDVRPSRGEFLYWLWEILTTRSRSWKPAQDWAVGICYQAFVFFFFNNHPFCVSSRWPSAGVSVRTSPRWTMRSWAAACATTTTRTLSTKRRASATSTASSATCRGCWERRHRRS